MNIKRILFGRVGFLWCSYLSWNELSFQKYWGGRIFNLNISKFSFQLDCRLSWLDDMVTGNIG